VHRENLVVEVRAEESVLGPRELYPHQHGEDAAEDEEGEGRDDEAPADRLVIRARQPTPQPRAVAPSLLQQAALLLFGQVAFAHFRLILRFRGLLLLDCRGDSVLCRHFKLSR
jgi:hypothetical protein